MGRDMDTTPVEARGSQKWLQILVNTCPGLLDKKILCELIFKSSGRKKEK